MGRVEILAPAGSYEALRGAINAGADAIYLGGSLFGARAFANNFNEEQLMEALDYAHRYGRKIYLTVNTLLKNRELEETLVSYLRPAYEHGLDAVIVQDLGVFQCIHENFPDLELHASTQMTTNSALSASLLKEMGASRVVVSRELQLEEIRKIYDATHMEVEAFIHGALCYSYSGQCLMSSMIGGRSGNRGRCAQSCRLPYQLLDGEGRNIPTQGDYLLSPKDICSLENLPDIIEAGVYSLKIEGRMKSPEYVAGVVSVYRKYVDLYERYGKKNYHVDPQDVQDLMDLFNRGNFSGGYYKTYSGPSMMSMKRPNHAGVLALEVVSCQSGNLKVKALSTIHSQDVVEMDATFTWTSGEAHKVGDVFSIHVPSKFRAAKGQRYYRTRNNMLLQRLQDSYLTRDVKRPVTITGCFVVGEPAYLSMECDNKRVECYFDPVEEAQNKAMDRESIQKQLTKLGTTMFSCDTVFLTVGENVFVPVGALNQMRRELVSSMEQALTIRRSVESVDSHTSTNCVKLPGPTAQVDLVGLTDHVVLTDRVVPTEHDEPTERIRLSAQVGDPKTLSMVLKYLEYERIYLDLDFMDETKVRESISCIQQAKEGKHEIYLALPHVLRWKDEKFLCSSYSLETLWESVDGLCLRNLEELALYQKLQKQEGKKKLSVVLDSNLYHMNDRAKRVFQNYPYTIDPELSMGELRSMNNAGGEVVLYGYQPMMISTQCIMKNNLSCQKGKKEQSVLYLRDRKQKAMQVVNFCRWCYNIIYNFLPTDLCECGEDLRSCGILRGRVDLTLHQSMEHTKLIEEILNRGILLSQGEKVNAAGYESTKGHFYRGVE